MVIYIIKTKTQQKIIESIILAPLTLRYVHATKGEKCLPNHAKMASYHNWCVNKNTFEFLSGCLPVYLVCKSIAFKAQNQNKQTGYIEFE